VLEQFNQIIINVFLQVPIYRTEKNVRRIDVEECVTFKEGNGTGRMNEGTFNELYLFFFFK
jgi:hypothetical protein